MFLFVQLGSCCEIILVLYSLYKTPNATTIIITWIIKPGNLFINIKILNIVLKIKSLGISRPAVERVDNELHDTFQSLVNKM